MRNAFPRSGGGGGGKFCDILPSKWTWISWCSFQVALYTPGLTFYGASVILTMSIENPGDCGEINILSYGNLTVFLWTEFEKIYLDYVDWETCSQAHSWCHRHV